MGYILVKLHDPSLSRLVIIHSRHRRQTERERDDRRHLMAIAELAMQYKKLEIRSVERGICPHRLTDSTMTELFITRISAIRP